MTLTRRRFLGATALLGLTACAAPAASAPARPLDSPEALADWIAANPENASLFYDDGRGETFGHLADRPRPIASSVKVVHLTAYAQAVATGRLDPAGPVAVRDWERWWVPGADGGVHPAALEALGATSDSTVTWDDIAAVMIDFSDNAAPDLLRETLGDEAIVAAAAAGGWDGFDLPCIAGEGLYVISTEPPPDRRAAALALGRAWAAGDPAVRELGAQYASVPLPGGGAGAVPAQLPEEVWDGIVELWDGAWAGTVTQLAGLHRAAATDAVGPDVSGTVRRHLERGLADRLPDGVLGVGQKGGNLPGVLSMATTVRRADGTVGVAVMSLSRLPQQVYQDVGSSRAMLLPQRALLNESVRDRVRAAVGA